MTVSTSASPASRARVPITSSASWSSSSRTGIRNASTSCRIRGSEARSSSGIFSRVALYSGYISVRELVPASMTTPR